MSEVQSVLHVARFSDALVAEVLNGLAQEFLRIQEDGSWNER